MSDEECPHGLDASWCSLCKAAAAPPLTRTAAPARRTSGGPSRAPRQATVRSRATAGPRPPTAPLSPAAALAKLRPALFHATALGAWESIFDSGLRTAAKLLADAGRTAAPSMRESSVDVEVGAGRARLRDQRLLARSRIAAHLDGISLPDWLGVLDERVHFFARQKDLTAMLARYQAEGQDLIVFDTAAVLAAAGDRVEVATVASGAPEAWGTCRCRGRETFVPLPLFEDQAADIEEVTVVGGLEDAAPLVARVVRYHPDRTTEVVWARS